MLHNLTSYPSYPSYTLTLYTLHLTPSDLHFTLYTLPFPPFTLHLAPCDSTSLLIAPPPFGKNVKSRKPVYIRDKRRGQTNYVHEGVDCDYPHVR